MTTAYKPVTEFFKNTSKKRKYLWFYYKIQIRILINA